MEIPLTPIQSSQILGIGYDAQSQTLAVQFKPFKPGHPPGTYHYSSFPPEKWEAFQTSESKGSFFGREIKGKFPHQRISVSQQ